MMQDDSNVVEVGEANPIIKQEKKTPPTLAELKAKNGKKNTTLKGPIMEIVT